MANVEILAQVKKARRYEELGYMIDTLIPTVCVRASWWYSNTYRAGKLTQPHAYVAVSTICLFSSGYVGSHFTARYRRLNSMFSYAKIGLLMVNVDETYE